MLKVDIKSKIYKMKNEDFKALDNVKFEINEPGIVCILGPSGSGKTTLMNIIGALDSDFDGDVVINDKSLKESKNKDLDSYRKNTIGFIFQQFYLINKFTSYDNIRVALNLSNSNDKKNKIKSLLKKVDMEKFSKRKVNLLSGGQKQRIIIARALANNPDIILADEPTGALDSKTSEQIMEILQKLSKTKLVMIITHSEELAEKYADRIIKMEDGKIVSDENIREKNEKFEDIKLKNNSKSTMSFFKAFGYSFKHMLSKKARTIATSIGMSIGIVGIGLALAMSNGTMKVAKSQVESIMPTNMITITTKSDENESNPMKQHMNSFTYQDVLDIKDLNKNIKHLWKVPSEAMKKFNTETSLSEENCKTKEIESTSFISQMGFEPSENIEDALTLGTLPKSKEEVVVSLNTAEYLLGNSIDINSILNKNIYVKFASMIPMEESKEEVKVFKIVGITSVNTMSYSIYQNTQDTLKLYEEIYDKKKEDIKFMEMYAYLDKNLSIDEIKTVTDELNKVQSKFKFEGASTSILSSVEIVMDVVKNVLIGFSSISVVVAILMIGIVIYISVIERISEIGILRAIGAKRKDILNIFISESAIIGLFSGLIGVGVTKGLCLIINNVIVGILNANGMSMGNIAVADLNNLAALGLIGVCVILSIISGLIPSIKAAKLDPIVALRRS